jgi:hypothetical protein
MDNSQTTTNAQHINNYNRKSSLEAKLSAGNNGVVGSVIKGDGNSVSQVSHQRVNSTSAAEQHQHQQNSQQMVGQIRSKAQYDNWL